MDGLNTLATAASQMRPDEVRFPAHTAMMNTIVSLMHTQKSLTHMNCQIAAECARLRAHTQILQTQTAQVRAERAHLCCENYILRQKIAAHYHKGAE